MNYALHWLPTWFVIKAHFCGHSGSMSRKWNAECGPRWEPRRARPETRIYRVVLLAKG